jgi:L-ascorbate metabolism protein UlaG (beta-lactamase superfamily)
MIVHGPPERKSMSASAITNSLSVIAVGGPTAVLELGGLRFITDPTFDPPGSYEPRPGVFLTKTSGPAMSPDDVGPVDVALLSHDHHMDNLDNAGRQLLADIPLVLSTKSAAERMGSAITALARWESVIVDCLDGGSVEITAVPAQHGPDGSEHLVGEVTGFVLTGEDLPTVYVSGDNASLDVVEEIAARWAPIDVAVLFAGGAQMPYLGDAYLTLPSHQAAQAARILSARTTVPLHHDSWAHFTEGEAELREAFGAVGQSDGLRIPPLGQRITV